VQLRWEGPDRVKGGQPFTVSVKATSSDPMRTLPLQLTYDPALVQMTNVRLGAFFADGQFTYRTDPRGSASIVISAKDKQPVDAELVILTFRPLRSGVTAELQMSLALPTDGVSLAPQAQLALRTAIVD
jgi:hypothetical protein